MKPKPRQRRRAYIGKWRKSNEHVGARTASFHDRRTAAEPPIAGASLLELERKLQSL